MGNTQCKGGGKGKEGVEGGVLSGANAFPVPVEEAAERAEQAAVTAAERAAQAAVTAAERAAQAAAVSPMSRAWECAGMGGMRGFGDD